MTSVFAAIMLIMEPNEPTDSRSERQAFDEALVMACSAIGVPLTATHREQMLEHFQRVVEANRHFNLTRIISPSDAAVKHYADSLVLLAAPWIEVPRPLRVLDVGTGAGFPAVPLAIACPQWQIVAVDGTGKKARFVAETAAALGLANLQVRHSRGEELAGESAGPFDLIVVRAVGKIAEVLHGLRQVISADTSVVLYKTDKTESAEMAAGIHEARRLGLSPAEPFEIELPWPQGPMRRRLIRFGRCARGPTR